MRRGQGLWECGDGGSNNPMGGSSQGAVSMSYVTLPSDGIEIVVCVRC
jgi:hypothetical protein